MQLGASSILLAEKEAALEDARVRLSRLRSDRLELQTALESIEVGLRRKEKDKELRGPG